jgi:hypothetical protein
MIELFNMQNKNNKRKFMRIMDYNWLQTFLLLMVANLRIRICLCLL